MVEELTSLKWVRFEVLRAVSIKIRVLFVVILMSMAVGVNEKLVGLTYTRPHGITPQKTVKFNDHAQIPATRGVGVSSAVQWTAAYRGISLLLFTTVQRLGKEQAFPVAHSERMHSEYVFRMVSNNSSFATKSCACLSVAFLAVIVSYSVNSVARLIPQCLPIQSQVTLANLG
jgi:hypothetical protein